MRWTKKIYRTAWRNRLEALKNIPAVLALVWQSGRSKVAAATACRLIVGILPLAGLWIGKLIIDLIAAAARHPAPTPNRIWFLLAAEFIIAALGAFLGRAIDYFDGRIGDEFAREVGLRIMKHAATLDLASFEDPVFYDRLERARVQSTDRVTMLKELGRLFQQGITLLSLSIAVMWYSPLLFALLIGALIPAFLGETHFAFLGYSLAYSLTPMKRELDYLRDLSTKKESAKEAESIWPWRFSAKSLHRNPR